MLQFTPCVILTEFHVVFKLTAALMLQAGVHAHSRTHTGTSHSAALWVLSVHNMAAIILLAGSGGLGQEGEGDKWGNEVRNCPHPPEKRGRGW